MPGNIHWQQYPNPQAADNTIICFIVRLIKNFKPPNMKTLSRLSLLIFCFFFYPGVLTAQQNTDSSRLSVTGDSSLVIDSLSKQGEQSAQTDNSSDHRHEKSYFKAGLSYMNDNVYLGRKDSVALPYITPLFGYYHKSGLFVEGSVGYLKSASQSRIDVVSLEGGYTFSAGNYDGEITASKFFYSSQSTSVKSDVKSSLAYFNEFDFGFITPTFTATLNFGNKTDIGGQFGLEHTFYAIDDKMDFTPTFTGNASTQNYYNNYYKNRRYTIKRKGKPPVAGIAAVSGTLLDASSFKVLDYEISLPINYKLGKFTFNFAPVYAIPVHPAQVEVTTTLANNSSSTKIHTEKIENDFFGTIGFTYKFGK